MINSVRHDTMECYSYEDWRDNIYPRITMINPHKIIHDAFIFNISKKERDMYIDMLIKEINQASFEKDERAKEGAAITATRESKAKWDARKKALIARKDSMVIWLKESARNPFSRADASGEHVEEENEGDADEGDEDEGDEDEDEGAQRVSMSSSSSNGSTSSTVEMG